MLDLSPSSFDFPFFVFLLLLINLFLFSLPSHFFKVPSFRSIIAPFFIPTYTPKTPTQTPTRCTNRGDHRVPPTHPRGGGGGGGGGEKRPLWLTCSATADSEVLVLFKKGEEEHCVILAKRGLPPPLPQIGALFTLVSPMAERTTREGGGRKRLFPLLRSYLYSP